MVMNYLIWKFYQLRSFLKFHEFHLYVYMPIKNIDVINRIILKLKMVIKF